MAELLKIEFQSAYEFIQAVDSLLKLGSFDPVIFEKEVAGIQVELEEDILEFNAIACQKVSDGQSAEELEAQLILLRLSAMNIATLFDNFRESIDSLIRRLD